MAAPWVKPAGDDVLVAVRVIARAGRNAIEGVRGDRLLVRVTAPPVGGAANDAVERLLAKAVGVGRGRCRVERGRTNREKTLRLSAMNARTVEAALGDGG